MPRFDFLHDHALTFSRVYYSQELGNASSGRDGSLKLGAHDHR
jgi:hypothetical protein